MTNKSLIQIVAIFISLIMMFFSHLGFGQSVAINTTGSIADTSAILDISSSSKGLLIPRVNLISLTTMTTINSPANSLLVYNTNAAIGGGTGYYYNTGTAAAPEWVKLVTQNDSIVKSVTPSGASIALDRFPMGEMSMNNNTTPTTLTQNVWTKVVGTSSFNSESYQFANGVTNNKLVYTGEKEKMFHITCTLSASAASNTNMKAVVFKNGTILPSGMVTTRINGSDVVSTAIHAMVALKTNDFIELYLMNTSNNNDLTILDMNMFAMGVSMGRD